MPYTQTVGGITLFEPKVDRNKNKFRILILGDSYTESGSKDDHWPNVFRKLLRRAHLDNRIEVINAAVAGYSAWQEKVSLQILAPVLRPDLVIATWVPNDNCEDLMYVGEGLAMPYLCDIKRLHDDDSTGYGPIEAFLIRNSRIYQFLLRQLFPKFHKPETREIVGPVFIRPAEQMGGKMVEHHLQQLREIREISINQGAVFCQVFFGFLTQNYPFICKNAQHCKQGNLDFLLDYGPQRFLQEQLNIQNSLNAIEALGCPLHLTPIWDDFGHFNTHGHRRVATIILRFLFSKLPLTEKEAGRLDEVLEEEEDWFSLFNTPICQGDFKDNSRLALYKAPEVIDEPPSYKLIGHDEFWLRPHAPLGFQEGRQYYLSIDGYFEGDQPTIIIRQKNQIVFKGKFPIWREPEVQKIVPKSIKFTSAHTTSQIEIGFNVSPNTTIVLRSWIISGGYREKHD